MRSRGCFSNTGPGAGCTLLVLPLHLQLAANTKFSNPQQAWYQSGCWQKEGSQTLCTKRGPWCHLPEMRRALPAHPRPNQEQTSPKSQHSGVSGPDSSVGCNVQTQISHIHPEMHTLSAACPFLSASILSLWDVRLCIFSLIHVAFSQHLLDLRACKLTTLLNKDKPLITVLKRTLKTWENTSTRTQGKGRAKIFPG